MMFETTTIIVVIAQLASTQPTYDNTQACDTRCSGGNSERATEHRTTTEMLEMLGRLQANVYKLRSDLAELKSNQQQSVAICPVDFTYIPAINGCYKVVLDNLTWSVAQRRCRLLHKNSHLVFINSAVEQNQIASMLSSFSDAALTNCSIPLKPTHHGKRFWTGGQRIDPDRESTFVWKKFPAAEFTGTGTLEMNYTYWKPREPNFGGSSESCIHLSRRYQYRWNDIDCDEYPSCPVCELDIEL